MTVRKLIDMHVHSNNSPDGHNSVECMCECAVKENISIIAITDHCEVQELYSVGFNKSIVNSYNDVIRARGKFNDKLMILAGMELGQPTQELKYSDIALNLCDFDYILASLHNIKDEKDFYYLDYSSVNIHELMTKYFDEILEIVEWNKFDVLAHLTYPLRYIQGKNRIKVDLSRYSKIIDEILLNLIKNEKGLEVNLSGFKGPLNNSMPNFRIIKRYKDLGGKIITIGTDSHKKEYIGKYIDKGFKIITDAGFEEISYYIKRKRYSYKII